jgi:hypothetical protein
MDKRRAIYLFIGAVANSALFFVIPDYYFWFLDLIAIGVLISIAIIIVDKLRKTKLWKRAIVVGLRCI